MSNVIFKIYNQKKKFPMGQYERPEMIGLRIMNFIMSDIDMIHGHTIYFIHELEMIWCYNLIKNSKLYIVDKRKKIKSLFPVNENNPLYSLFVERINNFEFDKEIKVLLEKDNGEWKDISSLNMDSEDEDISSWGGFYNFSIKINNIVDFVDSLEK